MSRTTILLADNDLDFQRTLAGLLEKEGYCVILAQDPATARGVLNANDIDLAILDIRMIDDSDEKDVSGLELAPIAVQQHIPCIILTNFQSVGLIRELLNTYRGKSGSVIDLLSKAEGAEAMLKVIEHALSLSRSTSSPCLR